MRPIIRVDSLSKQFRIGAQRSSYTTLRDALSQSVRAPFKRFATNGRAEHETIWALKDVSFEIVPGEVVGIIGANGAGKSTLLKILSRITEPTTGSVDLYGRVASLLEVGTGFHPELTGRENVYLNGAILGMRRDETNHKFDEIVAFAEVEKFIDTPVKHYSSGMYMRLAFAVAAHLEPEILIVDEVLAVGDSQFQKKCLGKMDEVAKQGRTVVFVSHNMAALRVLCGTGIYLASGRLRASARMTDVLGIYLRDSETPFEKTRIGQVGSAEEKIRLVSVRALSIADAEIARAEIVDSFIIEIVYEVAKPSLVLNLSIAVYNQEQVHVFSSASISDSRWHQKPHPLGTYRSRCRIPGGLLNDGAHSVSVIFVENGVKPIAQFDRALRIELVDLGQNRGGYFGYWGGVVRPDLNWETVLQR